MASVSATCVGKLRRFWVGRTLAWLKREEREKENRADLLLRALDLKPGLVVADIGAGTGFLSRRIARAVVPSGTVFAVDVHPETLVLLRSQGGKTGRSIQRDHPYLASEADVTLPPSPVDLATTVDVDHEPADPNAVLSSHGKALKPGGQVVFVEYRAGDGSMSIKSTHKMSERTALTWRSAVDTLPRQRVFILK